MTTDEVVTGADIPAEQSDIKSIRDNSHESLVLVCKELFTKLFGLLAETRVLSNPKSEWERLVKSGNIPKDRMDGLPELLDQVIKGSEATDGKLRSEATDYCDAFSVACSCLVELSSMTKDNNDSCEEQLGAGESGQLPAWL